MTLTRTGLGRATALDEHVRAVRKLEEAIHEQARLAETYQRSLGTGRELSVYMRFREARARVTACERWLHWVDDEDAVTVPPAEESPLPD